MTQQNPATTPIHYTLNINQVNLILEGLGKLPYEQVEQLYNGVRSVAICAMQKAALQREEDAQTATIDEKDEGKDE